jgi:hypothetical protein
VGTSSQLSPGAAVAIGLTCCAMGAFVILLALGVFGASLTDDTPRWVGVCGGLVFVLGGLALIVGYAVAGGVAPDGDLAPGTPFAVRLVQFLLGLAVSRRSWGSSGRGSVWAFVVLFGVVGLRRLRRP